MTYPINFKNITTEVDFYPELPAVYKKAERYLLGFKWCREIKNSFLYTNLGGIFCIFLFEIENAQSSGDNFLWVIVGDIPSMYLDTYGPKSTTEVLEDYIRLAEDWISHIKEGKSIDGCYPFCAEPTLKLAELLETKVLFMKSTLMDNIENIPLRVSK